MANKDGPGSTQNTQYDKIGTKYNKVKTLPCAEPEEPSVLKAMGNVKGKRCLDLACGTGRWTALLASYGATSVIGYDISSAMIDGARATYPADENPTLTFGVADCSDVSKLQHDQKFDVIFAGWFLNYAGTETELINMFRTIEQNLENYGKFVGVTTDVHDRNMHLPKQDFYGLDIVVLDPQYVAPDTGMEVGIRATVVIRGDAPFSFEVFQFKKEIYERCAEKAGLVLKWCEMVLPEDERIELGYWKDFIERPTFVVVEAKKL